MELGETPSSINPHLQLTPERCGNDLQVYFFELMLWIYVLSTSWENDLDDKITLVQQSGTKPNLVAKIWLPKLVANVSSNFHHLVNTGLAVGSFFKWLPITVAHTCKLDTIWVVYISPIGNGSIRLQSPLTHYALWNFTSCGAGLFSELAGAHT